MAASMKPAAVKKTKANTKNDCLEEQDIRQAVIIADNYNENFAPLKNETPYALFPLVNKPLLEYSLEILQQCNIQETFIFCSSHSQKIRNYINSKWAGSSMAVTVISSESFMSVGDAIRELDSKALIRSDFVLINGCVITTLPLITILEKHKKKRKIDKGTAMTLIYREASPKHKTRCKEDNVLLAVESNTKKIRYYQKTKNKRTFHIPLEVFQENEEVKIHYNALDSHICICSPSIPPLYLDNFDYQTLDDLIKGLLVNEEILGNSMYLYLAKTGYSAGVPNLYMYDSVSCDIMQRWSYPVVPDLFSMNGGRYSHLQSNVYKDKSVDLHRTSVLNKNVVLGEGTVVGENAFIENSVIGKNCSIGANVKIVGCYLWNNVIVGDFCNLNTSLLADQCVLMEHVTLSPGCVLSCKVVVGDYTEVPQFTRLQFEPPEDDGFGDEDLDSSVLKTPPVFDANYVGTNGQGYVFIDAKSLNEDEDEIEDECKDVWGLKLKEEEEESEEDEEDESDCDHDKKKDDEEDLEDEENDDIDDEDIELFYHEVLDSLQRGIEEKIKSDNLILEINSSKYAYNVTMKEVNSLLVKAILKLPLVELHEKITSQDYFMKLKPILLYFVPLIKNYIKSAVSMIDCLTAVEEFLINNEDFESISMKILHVLYEKEILVEHVILKWFEDLSSGNIKKQVAPFIKWLQEADEESSEED